MSATVPAANASSPSLPDADARPAPAAERAAPAGSLVARVPSDYSLAGFYPVLLIAGIALFAAARLFPHVGGRFS